MITNLIRKFSTASSAFTDFLICGGGLIGTTVACALAKHPCFIDKTITLIEASPEQTFTKLHTYSNRVSAISPFSKHLFQRLGVWKNVYRYKEVNRLKIWGVYSDNLLELDNKENVVAYVVENADLIQAVSKELLSLPNVRLIYKKKISDVHLDATNSSSLPSVILDDGSEISSQLLIGCDGINSKIRKAMDVNYLTWNYQQMAVVATLNISENYSNTTAWQKFLPDGPVALLPLASDISSLVWSTSKEKASNLLKIPKENFVDALNNSLQDQKSTNEFVKGINRILNFKSQLTSHELPPIILDVLDGSIAAFPLGFGHSANYVCPHIVLIGDAAHRIHPLAGQGVNLGFKDITTLEDVLRDGYKNGRELGDIEDLTNYETLCQQNNIPVMAFIELIHRVYTSQFGPIQAVGDIALQFANFVDPIRDHINKKVLFLRN